MATTLLKYAAESRIYTFDFSLIAEMLAEETISAVNSIVSSPTGPTIGTHDISVDGQKVNVLISGGLPAQYQIVCLVTTSGGAILEGLGILSII